ncbi:MAG: hypothetical protein AAFR87_33205 [Bacteroidota bacterium]
MHKYTGLSPDSIGYQMEVERLRYGQTQNAYGYTGHGEYDTLDQYYLRSDWY